MQESALTWAGTLALVALAALLLAFVWPETDGWFDDWRDYAHETRYGGVCSDPDAATRPAACDTAPPVELWMFVPWLMAVGSTASMLIICWPQTVPLRRQGPENNPHEAPMERTATPTRRSSKWEKEESKWT